jgi:hypothetical protein
MVAGVVKGVDDPAGVALATLLFLRDGVPVRRFFVCFGFFASFLMATGDAVSAAFSFGVIEGG